MPSVMTAKTSVALDIAGLTKSYGDKVALAGVDLQARPGEITAVLGPNGAGKSTTIECCVGLKDFDAGSITVLGLDPVRHRGEVRAGVGVMLQDGGLPMGARPLEVLTHMSRMYRNPRNVDRLAEQLGITEFTDRTIRRLSGGQRQRVALAAALIGRPRLVFLDEPSAGLDPQARLAVWELIEQLRSSSVAVVLTTHMMEDAERLADHVYIIDKGIVVASGTPAELTRNDEYGTEATYIKFASRTPVHVGRLEELLHDKVDPALVVESAGQERYQVRGPITPELVAAIAYWCQSNGILLSSLTVGRRSLEDVFLELTGRSLR
ncbi:ABC transporter ATP-binding protein [Spelaeicoccus albus]|nr:ABC transporter ATP-binding protein [Spelaeicoccus albus]